MRVKAWAVVGRNSKLWQFGDTAALSVFFRKKDADDYRAGIETVVRVEIRTLPARKGKRKVRTT